MSLFICGTDTNVGKTIVSSVLLKEFSDHKKIRYWKPVQTGPKDEDLITVRKFSEVQNLDLPGLYHFKEPLSPHRAAELENKAIDLSQIVNAYTKHHRSYDLIIEGAGGLLVPLNRKTTWLDFLILSKLPVVLVAHSGLGTINHSLLNLRVLEENKISVIGIIYFGPENTDNMKTISDFSSVSMIGHVDYQDRLVIHYLNREMISGYLLGGDLENFE